MLVKNDGKNVTNTSIRMVKKLVKNDHGKNVANIRLQTIKGEKTNLAMV